ncbi:MAG TPA: CarD family transcriptional regulator [Kofleriaceae bacterium]|nr:CarD family transcriptional regulator [Kofleriaceae bacterium]
MTKVLAICVAIDILRAPLGNPAPRPLTARSTRDTLAQLGAANYPFSNEATRGIGIAVYARRLEEKLMNDFRIGDKAVYPAHGVAEVIGVEKKEINATVCSFYVLKVLATGMQILVPKDKADQVGLRAVATSQEIEEVFDILREKDVHIDKQTWNRRYRGFMEKIKTGSLFDVAEVYRDLYRLKSSKVLSFGERKMLDNAKQLIVKELAVAKKWAEERVEQELEKACA